MKHQPHKPGKDLDKLRMQQQIELAGSPAPRAISIDVISMGAASKYRIVVSDLDFERPIWVGEGGRKEADIDLFFVALGEDKSARIELVAMDTWKPFRNSVLKNAAQARIIYDKFHIMERLSKALAEVRAKEYKRLETFEQLWDYRSEHRALAFLERWKESLNRQRLEPYLKFAELVESHWDGIRAYQHSENKFNAAAIEDINTKTRSIQQQDKDCSEEEYFGLQIIAAFLPPLPDNSDAG